MCSNNSLSVVIPVFNEEKSIQSALDGVLYALKRLEVDFEVIVVNDGSVDRTEDILLHYFSAEPQLKVLKHERNFGKGKALRTGIAEASSVWILLLDADLQIPDYEFEVFRSIPAESMIFAGYRNKNNYGLYRMIISWINACFTRLLFGLEIRDCNCPFKFLRAELLKSLNLSADGFGIDAELLWRSVQSGAKITEFPVDSFVRTVGVSKVTLSSCIQCVFELLKIRFKS